MSGNALTIVVGLIGVLASVGASALAYRYGLKAAHDEKEELLREITAQRTEILAQREVLAEVVEGFARLSGADRSPTAPSEKGDRNATAVTILVRAVMGTLLDKNGEVPFQRLLREVSRAVGHPSFGEVAEVLEQLRAEGLVDWTPPGSALDDAEVIKVHPRPYVGSSSASETAA